MTAQRKCFLVFTSHPAGAIKICTYFAVAAEEEEGIIAREAQAATIHAGFFLDSRDFYTRLRELPREKREQISMMPVSFTNSLHGDESARRAARRDARFVNSAMVEGRLVPALSALKSASARRRALAGLRQTHRRSVALFAP